MARKVTIRDVAAMADVSMMTVSNYVNGKFQFMSAKTRARVAREIKRLKYRPHLAGRDLRLAKRLTIGMIIFDESPTFLADPFNTYIVAGLSNYLSTQEYGVLLQGLTPDNFKHSPIFKSERTDGICVIMSSGTDSLRRSLLKLLKSLGQPLVVFQEPGRLSGADTCVIRQDDRDGGRQVGEHLLQRGAKRLLMLQPALNWPAIRERERGIRDALSKSRKATTLTVVKCGDSGFGDTQWSLASAIDSGGLPDAIVAGNDQMGIAAMKLVRDRGYRVPDDVLITGFNAFDFWQYTDPLLTSVHSPSYELGARGGEELLRRLNQGKFGTHDVVFPVRIMQGGST
jgi:LacI family transcriptional regulator